MEDVIAIFGFFAVVPLTVWAVAAYRFKRQKESVKLLTAMTDKGQEVTPEIIKTLGIQQRPKHSDLRTGLVLLAIGFALLLSGGAIPDEDGQAAFAAFSTFPILIGLVFISLWGFITRKPDA